MITNVQTDHLLSLPKYAIDKNGNRLDSIHVDIESYYDHRITLQAITDDAEYEFLLRIRRSEKYTLNLTLHIQNNESKDCLARVDYGGRHSNPPTILETLPAKFRPFVNKIINEPHLHYNIDGYKPSAWALPLSKTNFSPLNLENIGYGINFAEAICSFIQLINVQTGITFNRQSRLFV